MIKLVLGVLAAFAAGTAGVSGTQTPRALRLASALAREFPMPAGFVMSMRSDRAWSEAERRAARIPLPAGGNFNGVSWTTTPRLTTAQIEQILEYNALCQWLRARRDGRDRQVAAEVLSLIASWPAIRDGPTVVAELMSQSKPSLLRSALDDCDRAHVREVAVAHRTRLPPPR